MTGWFAYVRHAEVAAYEGRGWVVVDSLGPVHGAWSVLMRWTGEGEPEEASDAGRKPTATALKVIHGNPGKRPLNRHEPKPEVAVPTCPAHLNPSAKAEWKRVARQMAVLGMITELDQAVLASYCQAYGRWVEAERRLKDAPMVIKLASGVIQQSPRLAIANKQLELTHRFAAELGLLPVSRTRVDARPPRPASKFAGLLGGMPPNADHYLSGRYKP